jgi:hypothetical protein
MWHRSWLSLTVLGSILVLTSCLGSGEDAEQRHKNANTIAGKAGQAAHSVAKDSGKVAAAAARKLAKAAKEAHDGWQESAQADKEKGKK